MSLWISWVRPEGAPFEASRCERVVVARGSIPYSAVTQPSPLPLRKGGTLLLDAHRADDPRVAELDEARAVGVLQVAGGEADRPEVEGGAAVAAHALLPLEHGGVDLLLEVSEPEAHGRAPSTAGAGWARSIP